MRRREYLRRLVAVRLRRLRRWRRRIAPVLPAVVAACLAVLLAVGYVGVRAALVSRDVAAATRSLAAAETALGRGDTAGARARIDAAVASAGVVRGLARDPVWRAVEALPLLGRPALATRTLGEAVDAVVSDAARPLADAATSPDKLVRGTRIDVRPLVRAAPTIHRALAEVTEARARVAAVELTGIPPLDEARARLIDRLGRLAARLDDLDAAAAVLPAMLADGRRYLVVVQNNAEARATGGLIGAYAVLSVRDGRVRLDRVGPNDDLRDATAPVVALGAEYDARYARLGATRTWRSANLSPDFRAVGATVAALWKATEGSAVDGVVAVDPVALARLLHATGPVTLADGTRLTERTAVGYLLGTVYARYPQSSDRARTDHLADATRRVFRAVEERGVPGARLVEALASAAGTGHVQLYSTHPDEQRELERTVVSGALPGPGVPFLEVVTQNAAGGKLDLYLRRDVTYTARPAAERTDLGHGPVSEEQGTLTVTLHNTAPASGLPAYVTTRADLPPRARFRPGSNLVWLSVYLGVDATYTSATLDGRPLALEADTERGLGVFGTVVELGPGQRRTLQLHTYQPVAPGAAFVYRQQPLVVPDTVRIDREAGRG